jgi:molybdate transport system substrate-binding protein
MKTFVTLFCLMISFSSQSQTVKVASAGGFKPAMEEIKKSYEQQTGNHLTISYASVGSLYAQIKNGAPFDVFISADIDAPKKLEDQGLGITGTRISHSISRLVLWSQSPTLIDQQANVLNTDKFKHLAIPNPAVGVHGKSAVEALKNMGIYEKIMPKLVEGKNALQTFQYIESGNAELGFISYSLIYHKETPIVGSYWLVPTAFYHPMIEQAILLQRGKDNPAARQLLNFLTSPAGQTIITDHGYFLP